MAVALASTRPVLLQVRIGYMFPFRRKVGHSKAHVRNLFVRTSHPNWHQNAPPKDQGWEVTSLLYCSFSSYLLFWACNSN